jgi:hypothetical protein
LFTLATVVQVQVSKDQARVDEDSGEESNDKSKEEQEDCTITMERYEMNFTINILLSDQLDFPCATRQRR